MLDRLMRLDLYLASKSPRRQALLQQLNISYDLLMVDVDESLNAAESPEDYVKRVASSKAQAGWKSEQRKANRPVLAADTIVVLDGKVFLKPTSREDAIKMLQKLSGKTHQVLTAVALVCEDKESVAVSVNEVTFRHLTLEEIEDYWQTGEPADKAGAYAIQGIGAVFVKDMKGSYSGVMGLPLYEFAELLTSFCC